MKILFYNLGYCRGITGSLASYMQKGMAVAYHTQKSQKNVLDEIVHIINQENPDVFAYAEISLGALRNQRFNQHAYLTQQLAKTHAEISASKYGQSMFTLLPFHAGNGNGAVSFVPGEISPHYLRHSRKKLVVVIKTEHVTIFSVHLPLVSADRKAQLTELVELVNECHGDVVVCGDFNIFGGINELEYIRTQTNLQLAGERSYTFPSHKPRIELDVFLYRFHNPDIEPSFLVVDATSSDHLPIVLQW